MKSRSSYLRVWRGRWLGLWLLHLGGRRPHVQHRHADHGRIIAQLHIELPFSWARDRQCPSRKTIRNLHWLSELRIAGYRVEQEQVDAGQFAVHLPGRGTLEALEHRQAYQRGERAPVAGDAVAHHPEPK